MYITIIPNSSCFINLIQILKSSFLMSFKHMECFFHCFHSIVYVFIVELALCCFKQVKNIYLIFFPIACCWPHDLLLRNLSTLLLNIWVCGKLRKIHVWINTWCVLSWLRGWRIVCWFILRLCNLWILLWCTRLWSWNIWLVNIRTRTYFEWR